MKVTWYLIECSQSEVNNIVHHLHNMRLPLQSKPAGYTRHSVHYDWRVWCCSADDRTLTMLSLMLDSQSTRITHTDDFEDVTRALGAEPRSMKNLYRLLTQKINNEL